MSKALGKKEKKLGPLYIGCVDCGTMTDIDDTPCPGKIKKLAKRNMNTRAIVMVQLNKLKARCPDCHKKFMDQKERKEKDITELTKEEAYDKTQEAVNQFKKETEVKEE